jgi:hypothetical protein
MNGKQSQQLATACEIRLPQWLPGFLAEWDGELDTVEGRMALTIALSRQNVERSRGGPFAAVVYDLDGGSLVAAGVNLVTALNLSCAHAEIVALSLAQHAEKTWNLGERGSAGHRPHGPNRRGHARRPPRSGTRRSCATGIPAGP